MTSNTGAQAHPRIVRSPASAHKASPIGQAIMALFIGFGLLVLLIALLPGMYARMYDGRIFPGVAVGGVNLSGMNTEQAAALLAERLDYPQRGKIVFQEGTNLWTAKPAELGLTMDTQTTALAPILRSGPATSQPAWLINGRLGIRRWWHPGSCLTSSGAKLSTGIADR
jgi:hypothetical protein